MLTFTPYIFGLGCVGGLLPDILRIIKNRHDSNVPSYLKRFNFWLGVILLVALGGFAAWLLEATNAKEAVTFGFAAPQVISSLVGGSKGVVDRGAIEPSKFGLRIWWAS